ncbi:sensor histidine kinase [Sphingomonas sp. GB1N7]|uniref:sensor histidine kinase n=1 Tax=Parasphingomonas caseinilytica TaxID=3096158 RepID=UPI002FC8D68C
MDQWGRSYQHHDHQRSKSKWRTPCRDWAFFSVIGSSPTKDRCGDEIAYGPRLELFALNAISVGAHIVRRKVGCAIDQLRQPAESDPVTFTAIMSAVGLDRLFTRNVKSKFNVAVAILLLGVLVQMGVTIAVSNQYWSVPIGLALLSLSCAVIVYRSTPVRNAESWRWKLIAIGLVFWSLMFMASAYQDTFLGGVETYSSILGGIKQLCFVAVLTPSSSRENDRAFRILDIFQGILFVGAIMILIWGSVINITIKVSHNYVNTTFIFMSALSLASYFSQKDVLSRKFIFNIVLLQIGYGALIILAGPIAAEYNLPHGSAIWAIGGVVIVIFGIRSSKLAEFKFDRFENEPDGSGPLYQRHIPPLFLTGLLTFLAFEIVLQNVILGIALGTLGFLNYSTRTALLLDRYLTARDRLIAAEQQHSRLLIDMIHEVRAPLGSMVLNASMLQRSAELPDRQARWAEQIGIGGARVTTMLNDVLDIERIDAGLIGPDLTDCDIAPIVDAAIAVATPQAAAAEITIEMDGSADRRIRGDRTLLERVLVNLLTNAVRFTAQGGTIRVAIAEDGDDMIAIRVIDNGLGIAPDILPKLFDRFSHTGVPLRGCPGSGLGLSICRGLMTLMRGNIAIDSRLGHGTTATLFLPRTPALAG